MSVNIPVGTARNLHARIALTKKKNITPTDPSTRIHHNPRVENSRSHPPSFPKTIILRARKRPPRSNNLPLPSHNLPLVPPERAQDLGHPNRQHRGTYIALGVLQQTAGQLKLAGDEKKNAQSSTRKQDADECSEARVTAAPS